MLKTAKDIKEEKEKRKKREEEKTRKQILKSKNRNALLCWLEYTNILISINIRARIFNLNGYRKYTNFYRISDKTIKKLEKNSFTVWDDRDYGNIWIHW